MLNPNNDRLDYGQILAPPAGYYLVSQSGRLIRLTLMRWWEPALLWAYPKKQIAS